MLQATQLDWGVAPSPMQTFHPIIMELLSDQGMRELVMLVNLIFLEQHSSPSQLLGSKK